ncbi:hypothetical protein BC938DRAFT_479778, partial [Jimgerdemannia flammicorona]
MPQRTKRTAHQLVEDAPATTSATTDPETKHVKTDAAAQGSVEGKGKAKAQEEEDAFGDQLTCGICHEILYKAVSLLPCLHTFCAACYSDWLVVSDKCPSCRDKAQAVRVNHLLNNVVDVYLKQYPKMDRTEEDKKECDERNKISKDMLTGKDFKKLVLARQNSINDDVDEDDADADADEDEDEEDEDPYF